MYPPLSVRLLAALHVPVNVIMSPTSVYNFFSPTLKTREKGAFVGRIGAEVGNDGLGYLGPLIVTCSKFWSG